MTQDIYPPIIHDAGLIDIVYFTSSGTFSKADYPSAKAIRVTAQAGGGHGGDAPTAGSGQHASASGGGAGGRAVGMFSIDELPASASVTVGAGGTSGGGGFSQFGSTLVRADGGAKGSDGASSSATFGYEGGDGGSGTHGDVLYTGAPGGWSYGSGSLGNSGDGGSTPFGAGGRGRQGISSNNSLAGRDGSGYGAGGSGALTTSTASSATGGNGAPGIVIVEVFSQHHGLGLALTDESTQWTDVTFQNSWVNYGGSYQNVQYRKLRDGRVELRGLMKNGTLSTAAFTLPPGYRPSADLIFVAISGGNPARIDVKSDGSVLPFSSFGASNSFFSVSGMSFDPT